jgi:hypothetical protein
MSSVSFLVSISHQDLAPTLLPRRGSFFTRSGFSRPTFFQVAKLFVGLGDLRQHRDVVLGFDISVGNEVLATGSSTILVFSCKPASNLVP